MLDARQNLPQQVRVLNLPDFGPSRSAVLAQSLSESRATAARPAPTTWKGSKTPIPERVSGVKGLLVIFCARSPRSRNWASLK